MKRRALLASVGVSVAVGGCAELTNRDASTGRDDDIDRTDVPGTTGYGPGGSHYLFLANLTGDTQCTRITLTRTDATDTTILSGTYELHPGQAAEFRDVAGWQGEYEVTARLPSGESETFEWRREPCGEMGGTGGSRNASLRVGGEDGPFSFVVDSCDAIIAGTAAAPGPASAFAVGGCPSGD
ncbi:hypothetical protein [Haloarchaeobius iranensis]|uniref:Ig-like domain-containing protein n=1 Tax=Haloarchaeobius iranensis TaxID=996166 RepID=A0A1G9U304_9EURY|nr:hypothetical protein [Haloarchaeobius iranensis]SDM54359.1 hypothetical protein SAMN05192554_103279 [Haloarchaeobius iranensis]